MEVREALLKATIKLFGEVGSRGATTRRIAQEAGVNEVTLFRHFASKEILLSEALRWFAEQVTIKQLPDRPTNPAAELTEWARDHHRHLYKIRALIRTSMGEYEEHPEQCAHAMKGAVVIANQLTDYLTQLKTLGLASGDWDALSRSSLVRTYEPWFSSSTRRTVSATDVRAIGWPSENSVVCPFSPTLSWKRPKAYE